MKNSYLILDDPILEVQEHLLPSGWIDRFLLTIQKKKVSAQEIGIFKRKGQVLQSYILSIPPHIPSNKGLICLPLEIPLMIKQSLGHIPPYTLIYFFKDTEFWFMAYEEDKFLFCRKSELLEEGFLKDTSSYIEQRYGAPVTLIHLDTRSSSELYQQIEKARGFPRFLFKKNLWPLRFLGALAAVMTAANLYMGHAWMTLEEKNEILQNEVALSRNNESLHPMTAKSLRAFNTFKKQEEETYETFWSALNGLAHLKRESFSLMKLEWDHKGKGHYLLLDLTFLELDQERVMKDFQEWKDQAALLCSRLETLETPYHLSPQETYEENAFITPQAKVKLLWP